MKVELLPDGLPRHGYVRMKSLIRPAGPLPVCASTIWNWVANGLLTPVKLGPRVTMFDVDQVRRVIASQGQSPGIALTSVSAEEIRNA